MHDDFVDDDLGKQRDGQRHYLDRQRGKQHIAPDALVFEQLWDKPLKAKFPLFTQRRITVRKRFRTGRKQQYLTGKQLIELGHRPVDRCLAVLIVYQHAPGAGLEYQREPVRDFLSAGGHIFCRFGR